MDRRFECRWGAVGARGCAFLVATAALSACGGQTGQNSSSPPSPAAARSYETGRGPASVAIGDLNGDGMPDLVTANYWASAEKPPTGANTVSVLLNRGAGRFRAKRDYRTGHGPVSVAIADLDGDGKADVATANAGPDDLPAISVSVLLNNGDATFQPKLDYKTGGSPLSVAVGDLNNDREPDLATANGTTAVSVLIDTPGLCAVQDVRRKKLPAATLTLARVNCQIGMIRRAYSRFTRKGRVISQKPRFGAVLPGGRRVNLVVSRGRRP